MMRVRWEYCWGPAVALSMARSWRLAQLRVSMSQQNCKGGQQVMRSYGQNVFQTCMILNKVLPQETSETVNIWMCLENLHEQG